MIRKLSPDELLALDIFNHDTYKSNNVLPKTAFGRFWFRKHWIFVAHYLRILADARKLALSGKYNTFEWVKSSFRIMRLNERCGANINISGMDNILASKQPVVFISNHMSTFETMVFPCLIASRREVTFVVKDSLISHPLFGPVMRARKPIVVSRQNSRNDLMKVIEEGADWLKKGTSIVIFPQSTRRTDFNPADMNTLGIKLAKKAGVKVVPVAIKTDFWEQGKILKDLGPLRPEKPVFIKFGMPLEIEGNGKNQHKHIVDFISDNYNYWCKITASEV